MKPHKELCDYLEEIFKGCLSVILTFACYPVFILVGIIFLPYRYIIDIILKVKTGEKYGGLLEPSDAFFFREEKTKQHITSILIIKSKKSRDVVKEYKQVLQKKIFDSPHYPKLSGTVGKFGGYLYLTKNTCNLDECMKELEIPQNVTFDEDYLKQLTGLHVNKPLPKNNTVLWEFLISKKPLKYTDTSDGFYYYPFIARVHHSVGDGTSLMTFLLYLFGDEETEKANIEQLDNIFNKSNKKTSFFKTLLIYIGQMKEVTKDIILTYFMGLGRSVQNELTLQEKNALHGPVLTGEKIVAWAAEDRVKLVPLVKSIKTRLNSKFSCVIMTAISASLTNFFKRNSLPIPRSLRVLLARLLGYPMYDKSKPFPLKNKAVGICIDMPTHLSNSLIETLEMVSKPYDDIKNGDLKVNRFIFKYSATIPIHLHNKVISPKNQMVMVTNVPGGAQVKLLDGCVLEKVIPLPPNFNQLGVSFGILTYDNRFQLGLSVDKALIPSQKEAQRIIDDVFCYIKSFDQEIKELETNSLE